MRTDLEIRAEVFATARHAGQVRKYTGEDYIVHPAAVANIVRTVGHNAEMLAAAWLHDVVEDTFDDRDIGLAVIKREFGPTVAAYVESLTDVSKPTDGTRAIRKAIDREHTAKASPEAKTIKLADLIDNTKSIVEHDADFAKIYLKEKALLLEVLKDGDKDLMKIALDQINK